MSAPHISIRTTAVLVAFSLAASPVLMGQSIAPCVHEARFGLIGLARLQTARLNVVNLLPPDPVTPPDPIHPPDPHTPPDPCHFAIGFLLPDGRPFTDAAGVPIIIEGDLRAGDFAGLDLQSADAFRASRSLRLSIRPTALLTHMPVADGAPEPCGAVVPTLEIYEPVSGRTQVFAHPSEILGFNPQPEPPGELSPGSH
jgi:hypothetical protein